MPLRVSQHSKGERIAPPECCTFLIRWNGPSSLLATTPPITSEWPPRYFVVACTTRSAPSSRGHCRTGVAQVLSQASRAPASRAIPEISRTSVIFRRGFEGVSTQNNLVLGRTAPPTSSAFVISIKEVSTPQREKRSRKISLVPK